MPARQAELRAPTPSRRACRRAGRRRSAFVVEAVAQRPRASGSRRARNSFAGRPPQASEYIALWPAAQTQRSIFARVGRRRRGPPGRSRRARPSCAAASKTSGATFRQCQIFDQNHSDEYVPPIGARYCGACSARGLGDRRGLLGRRCGPSRARRARRGCLPPRVERERPALRVDRDGRRAGRVDADADDLRRGEKPGSRLGRGQRARRPRRSRPGEVVGGVLPREVRVLRVEQDALVAATGSRRRAVPTLAAVARSPRRARGRSWCRSRCRGCRPWP